MARSFFKPERPTSPKESHLQQHIQQKQNQSQSQLHSQYQTNYKKPQFESLKQHC